MKKLIKHLILVSAISYSAIATAASTPTWVSYNFPITRVVDGDTVEFAAAFLPAPLPKKLSLRIYGVDTPEKGGNAECPAEAVLAERATVFTTNAISSGKVTVINLMKWDKYGGRVIGDLFIDGRSLRESLIANGLAREYYGATKTSWCTQ
ncbi:COG1525 Micrococcal nuclease (thermonuclease) homologs [uncultured Caudovirales phage]|uniref:COG1525 Micrococcal nuclease (Thermonuclease) homologs n=1 Tax=uncultured Caudovirales phage TaxID=2100421 RepID=A0A6J5L912_9CAUD|nr:COG1525 Micrococcal nuclease (thermonuclease) homologs [uncultured Caudovirales phage]